MPEIRVHNTIDATPDAVWAVLSDVGGWEGWNEVMVAGRCDGAEVGAVLSCKVAVGPIWFPVKSRLTVCSPGEALEWGEDRGSLLRIHHGFTLHPTDEGTRIEHYESFDGALGRVVFPIIQGSLTRNYARFLEELKDRVEQAS